MKYTVTIRQNSTGEMRAYTPDLEWKPWNGYWLFEGNMSCDCNRATWFALAGEEKPPEDHDCGSEAYDFVRIVMEDGTEIYHEDHRRHLDPCEQG